MIDKELKALNEAFLAAQKAACEMGISTAQISTHRAGAQLEMYEQRHGRAVYLYRDRCAYCGKRKPRCGCGAEDYA